MAKRKKLVLHEKNLLVDLKNQDFASAYLTECLKQDLNEGGSTFLTALRLVAQAHGFAKTAKAAKLGRESLYKALSDDGNPTLSTLLALFKALGVKVQIESIFDKAS